MINKTKLGEDIDLLLDKISTLQSQLQEVSESHDRLLSTMPNLILMIESMIRLLSEKKIFTTDEFTDKLDEMNKLATVQKDKVLKETKDKYMSKYFTYLLTKSKYYGNA